MDHFDYEDKIAFPYFIELIEGGIGNSGTNFSVSDYRDHHSDTETKLADL